MCSPSSGCCNWRIQGASSLFRWSRGYDIGRMSLPVLFCILSYLSIPVTLHSKDVLLWRLVYDLLQLIIKSSMSSSTQKVNTFPQKASWKNDANIWIPREVVSSLPCIAIYTDDSVTKDQSVLGSKVKHCGKTKQEDIGTNNAINFKLTGEVETVICILQWLVSQVDTMMTHASILTSCLKHLKKCGVRDGRYSHVQIFNWKRLYISCPDLATVHGNEQADWLAFSSLKLSMIEARRSVGELFEREQTKVPEHYSSFFLLSLLLLS